MGFVSFVHCTILINVGKSAWHTVGMKIFVKCLICTMRSPSGKKRGNKGPESQ